MSSEVNPVGGSGAAEHVGSVKDMMVESLVRVPAKSMTRLKLVSKGLCSLISDPEFVKSHAQVWILKSSSGLLLCRYSIDDVRYSNSPDNLLVGNPSTKQYRKIPPPKNVSGGSGWHESDLYFAFDPSVSPHYKLVCVRYQIVSKRSIYLIEVYSFHNHKRRLLLESNELNMVVGSDNVERYSNWRPLSLNCKLYHFDLKSEALVRIRKCRPIPDRDISINYSRSIGMISKEYPCILCVSLCYTMEDSSISILEMSQDLSEWVAKYRVNLCELTSAYPEIVRRRRRDRLLVRCDEVGEKLEAYKFQAIHVVEGFQAIRVVQGFHSKGEPELVLAIPAKIISYNFMKKTVKTLHNLPHIELPQSATYDTAFQYTESLSSV